MYGHIAYYAAFLTFILVKIETKTQVTSLFLKIYALKTIGKEALRRWLHHGKMTQICKGNYVEEFKVREHYDVTTNLLQVFYFCKLLPIPGRKQMVKTYRESTKRLGYVICITYFQFVALSYTST